MSGDRPARARLTTESREAFGASDALIAAGFLAVVEAVDALTDQVRRLTETLGG